jgi:hypothetical protein
MSSTAADIKDVIARTSCDQSIQCNLGNDQWKTMESRYQAMREKLALAREKLAEVVGDEDSDAPSSLCEGFSDYGSARDGFSKEPGVKLVLGNFPASWTKRELTEFLERRIYDISHLGVRGQRAAIFVRSKQSALQAREALHLTLVNGNLVTLEVHDDFSPDDLANSCYDNEEISASEDLPENLVVGDRVRINGLVSSGGLLLNGALGVVKQCFEESNRYGIAVGVKVISIKRENLSLESVGD